MVAVMKTRLDLAYLGLLAALGLGCTPSTGTEGGETGDTSGTTTTDSASATETNSTSGDGDGDSTSGDGDGDTTSGDGDGDGDTTTGDGDGDPPPPPNCENPVPIMQLGTEEPSGFYTCDGGFIARGEAVECLVPEAVNDEFCADFGGSCQTAEDCDAKPYGGCASNDFEGLCQCNYGCATDADCDEGYICACAGVAGGGAQCIPSDCATNDDCEGGLCGLSLNMGVCENTYSAKCTGPTDECLVSSDCEMAPCPDAPPDSPDVPYYCTASGEPGWTCEASSQCDGVCGRPFFVAGEARVADARGRHDWCASLTELEGLGEGLDAALRERLADHWREVAGFEHASVASFARFIGHLQQLGAPASLVRAAQQAAIDEIEHARLAYALASAYAGAELGPAALAIDGAIDRHSDRRAILDALIHEACVGETLAALEAREAASLAEDPRVAACLDQIATDELRHAALGWQALQWMLATASADERSFVERRLARAIALAQRSEADGHSESELHRHGLLDDARQTELRTRAIAEVLVPLAASLLETQPVQHTVS